MICKTCNHEIGPEELKCPHCGAENPFALTHQQNMEQFRKDYAKTRTEVISSAQKTGGLAKKAAVLIALIIGCIIMRLISSYNYADHNPEDAVRKESLKNAAKYASEADGYLSRGEYTEYMSFLYAHELQYSAPEELDHLRSVTYVAEDYYNCIKLMEEIVLRSTDPEYFDGLDTDIRNFCMYLNGFYEVYEAQKSIEKDEKYLAYIDDMEVELKAAMRTYFSMDENALEEFISLSEAKKALKLEEVFRHE
ncbi:MAG: hypothetical protein J6X66_09130 [Lachnospiraceae bacterium]|nr:hypothetical protein [Lachnospiraceae bacterium]